MYDQLDPADDEFYEDVVNRYPLPIAHEYWQLCDARGWWDQCQQLKEVLEISLRYCTLIVLSDYLDPSRSQALPEDKALKLKAFILDTLRDPQLEGLHEMLLELVAAYQEHSEELMVPQLYAFCYSGPGQTSPSMRLFRRLIDGFADQLQTLDRGQLDRLKALYLENKPEMDSLLGNLAFLKEYDLLRVPGTFSHMDGGCRWTVNLLMGYVPRKDAGHLIMPAEPKRDHVALWDRKSRLLELHPFALFDKYKECRHAFNEPNEELFLYRRAERDQVHYIGLCETENVSHWKVRRDTLEEIRKLLNSQSWPTDWKPIPVFVPPPRMLNWQGFQGLAETYTRSQLQEYRVEKYDSDVYLPRESVQVEFDRFLAGDKNGLLIVGDSGTGKSNLCCRWVEDALRGQDNIVLFYNCRKLTRDEVSNLGAAVAWELGRRQDFGILLDNLAEVQGGRGGRFFLILDGLNENEQPQLLLQSLWRDVLSQVPFGKYTWFKVIISCRSEAWRKLEKDLEGKKGPFHQTSEGVAVWLPRFTGDELPTVYAGYQKKYVLKPDFDHLSDVTKRLISDPLMLRFVAEGYQGARIPRDPRTVKVIGRYLMEKVGNEYDEKLNHAEKTRIERLKTLLRRLVELMYLQKTDELSEQDLYEDEQIGQSVLARDDMNSPYFRALELGILSRTVVEQPRIGGYGFFSPQVQPEARVRFTYDRVFEYLLADYLLPSDCPLTVAGVKELSTEATRERYPSLWGALKVRLIAYAEMERRALSAAGVLAELAREKEALGEDGQASRDEERYWLWQASVRHAIRGLVVDMLVSYGSIRPERVQRFLTTVLLRDGSEQAGLVATFVAYRMLLPAVFEQAYSHTSKTVREAAIQHTYFYWSRYRQQGEEFLSQLAKKASGEAIRFRVKDAMTSVPRRALQQFRGGDVQQGGDQSSEGSSEKGEGLDLSKQPILDAFLNTTLLLAGYFLTEPNAVRRTAQNILDLYEGFAQLRLKDKGVQEVQMWAGVAMIRAWKKGGVVNMDTLAIFTRRPLDDAWRKEVADYAPYMGCDLRSINEIGDKLFEWSLEKDGVVSLVLVGILTNRSIHEPRATLDLMKRMFSEGNEMSQYNVVRTMSSVLQRRLDLCEGFLEFFNEAILDIWRGTETVVCIEGKTYGLGHLAWALTFECQKRESGKIEFVERLLDLPWDGNPVTRLKKVIDELGTVGINALKMASVKPYPVLETLSQWFDPESLDLSSAEDVKEVEHAVARALARIWRAYPDEVEAFLESEPRTMMRMSQFIGDESPGGMANFGAQGMTAIVFMDTALPGLVQVLQRICRESTDAEKAVPMLGEYFLEPETMEKLASWQESE